MERGSTHTSVLPRGAAKRSLNTENRSKIMASVKILGGLRAYLSTEIGSGQVIFQTRNLYLWNTHTFYFDSKLHSNYQSNLGHERQSNMI